MSEINIQEVKSKLLAATNLPLAQFKNEIKSLLSNYPNNKESQDIIINLSNEIENEVVAKSQHHELKDIEDKKQYALYVLEQKLLEFEEEKRLEAKKHYEAFSKISDKLLQRQTNHNKNLEEALKYIKKSEAISERVVKNFEVEDNEIKEIALMWQEVQRAHNTSVNQIKYAKENIEKIEDGLNAKNISVDEHKILSDRKDKLTKDIAGAKEVKAKCEVHFEERNKDAINLHEIKPYADKNPTINKEFLKLSAQFNAKYNQNYEIVFNEIEGKKHDQSLKNEIKIKSTLEKNCDKNNGFRGAHGLASRQTNSRSI